MLYSTRYAGLIPYGRMRRVYRGGTQKREVAGKAMLAERPDLRIISEPLWQARDRTGVQLSCGASMVATMREQLV
jgi:hypothetical protein